MRLKDIKGMSDLKEIDSNDVADLLDELRGIATKRGTELFAQGRTSARKALGAPAEGAVGGAFLWGVLLGAAVGAVVALLMTPTTGTETRRRIGEQVDKARERMPEMPGASGGDGRSVYERTGYEGATERSQTTGIVS